MTGADARERIIDAAERLLRERPYRDLSVDAVMVEAGLSRTIFYRHFESLAGVVRALLADIETELHAVLVAESLAGVLRAAIDTYAAHGPFLRAVQAAASHDPGLEATWDELGARFVTTMTEQFRASMAAGIVAPGDPAELARAMNLFNNAYLVDTLGRDPGYDRERALATLLAVWEPLTSHGV